MVEIYLAQTFAFYGGLRIFIFRHRLLRFQEIEKKNRTCFGTRSETQVALAFEREREKREREREREREGENSTEDKIWEQQSVGSRIDSPPTVFTYKAQPIMILV